MYILARQFDQLKVSIDQFLHVFQTNYTQFNQAPDALLEEVGRYFGWEFTGNFLNSTATQYILGKNVLRNIEANRELDLKLFEIKNEFWRRTLINLIYLYKTKGTRESVESLLRIYGVNRNFVRLKEFGYRPEVGIETFRISSDKSVSALTFDANLIPSDGSNVSSAVFSSRARSIETRVCFPTIDSIDMPATILSGNIWTVKSSSFSDSIAITSSFSSSFLSVSRQILDPDPSRLAFYIYNNSVPNLYIKFGTESASFSSYSVIIPQNNYFESNVNWLGAVQAIVSGSGGGFTEVTELVSPAESVAFQLSFLKDSISSTTGSLILTSSNGQLILSGANIFDERWYNIAVLQDPLSSSLSIDVRSMNDDNEVDKRLLTSQSGGIVDTFFPYSVNLGSTNVLPAQQWVQEFRVWEQTLSNEELEDHVLNFQSYGTEEVNGFSDLSLHWRLNEDVSADDGGYLALLDDVSGNENFGSGSLFTADSNPYKRFLFNYEYIAPTDFGWNEEKIRSIDASSVKPKDGFLDNRIVSLEFNMVDALNEDISQIVSTMDSFNEFIGQPANKYRDSYPDLDILRRNYFKRLQGRLNFRVFADMLEFFDNSFIDMIRRLIPARANFLGDEFVVESHMLERPKMQWNYRRQQGVFQPEGAIKVYIRT